MSGHTLNSLKIFILFNLVLWIASCAVNPVTGKRELMLLSDSDEVKMGIQSDKQVVETYGVYDDKELHNYLDRLGQEMAKVSHRPELKYEFKLMDSPVINAFAVPGGFVYITRGILAYLNNEAELAGVVGHEIGHITARHSAKQYSKGQLAQLGLGLGSVFSEEFSKYAGLAEMGVGVLFLKFSRDNERQSDDLGVEYSTKTGYDAREMANFFITLDRMSEKEDEKGLPSWFSTHPNPENRVGDIRKQALVWQKKVNRSDLKINRDEYMRKIDGLVYGEDPRQGFVEKGVFYHPGLKFQFPAPTGWKVNNLPTQVQIIAGKGEAVILFTLDEGSSPLAAAQKFISKNKAVAVYQNDLKVNTFRAYKVVSKITTDQGVIQVMSYFIMKDNQIFTFHGLTSQQDYEKYSRSFENTMNGFNLLNDRSKLDVKPDRIRIKRTVKAGMLELAFQDFGIEEALWKELALMNGKELDENIPADTPIKIIEKGR